MTENKRIDNRKGDRHKKPRQRNGHQEQKAKGLQLIPAYIEKELISHIKNIAQERGVSFRQVARESFQRTVAEHEQSRTSADRPPQVRHDKPASNVPAPGKKA